MRHMLDMKGKSLRRWLALRELDQRCVAECFRRKPIANDLRAQRKQQRVRIATAALTRHLAKPALQHLLASNLAAGSSGSTHVTTI